MLILWGWTALLSGFVLWPTYSGNGDAIVPIGVLALAWDHRAFDGAYAASFLRRVRDVLESSDWAGEWPAGDDGP